MNIDRLELEGGENCDLLGTNTERLQIKLGRHGFIGLVDMMPRVAPKGRSADFAIVQAARVSTGQGLKSEAEDIGLLRYLMRHRHTTPFEMVEFKFHVSLPIFLARQWIRHRTASVNEVSARYTELPDNYWLPGEWRRQGTSNKQGGEEPMEYEPDVYESLDFSLGAKGEGSVEDMALVEYHRRIAAGVSREMARSCLPVSIYTQWYWKCDLHNILHFLSLRMDSHAQFEIREYANALCALIEPFVPETIRAFRDYRLEAVTLSRLEMSMLHAEIAALKGTPVPDGYSLTITNKRENDEWQAKRTKLGLIP